MNRFKKTLAYLLNGALRSALPVAGVALSAVMITAHFENISLTSFKDDNPVASAEEIYDELGIIGRYSYRRDCDIDAEQLALAFADADIAACIEGKFDGVGDFNTTAMLAPAAFVGVASMKAMPKGAAYFQIAYKEAVNSKTRVLRESDFEAMRAKKLSQSTPPQFGPPAPPTA